ncbi:MAG: hypothetical protein ACTS5I_03645, partial [Rhodanobacter sp.]
MSNQGTLGAPLVRVARANDRLESGQGLLSSYPAGSLALSAAPVQLVAGWTSPIARPVEVALFAEYSSESAFPPPVSAGYVGSDITLQDPRNPAFFKIEYGCGAIVRTRYVDLQSARLYLGVCDNVRVSIKRWRGSTTWFPNP